MCRRGVSTERSVSRLMDLKDHQVDEAFALDNMALEKDEEDLRWDDVAREDYKSLSGEVLGMFEFLGLPDQVQPLSELERELVRTTLMPPSKETWKQVGGLAPLIQCVRDSLVIPFQSEPDNQAGGWGGGRLLLHGPKGCGKSLIAKCISNETQSRLMTVDCRLIKDSPPSSMDQVIRSIFSLAAKVASCVILLKNIYSFAPALVSSMCQTADHRKGSLLLKFLISEMDLLVESGSQVLLVATTSRQLKDIDPQLVESFSGRKGLICRVSLPSEDARLEIIKLSCAKSETSVVFDDHVLNAMLRDTQGWRASQLIRLMDTILSHSQSHHDHDDHKSGKVNSPQASIIINITLNSFQTALATLSGSDL